MCPEDGVEHVLLRSVHMNFALTAEQAELKKSARRVLAATCASAQVRAAMETERGTDDAAWRTVCELGWPSLVGVGWVELAAVGEEAGRLAAADPAFSAGWPSGQPA